MLLLINKYLRGKAGDGDRDRGAAAPAPPGSSKSKPGGAGGGMPPPASNGDDRTCLPGCVPVRGGNSSSKRGAGTSTSTTTTTTTTTRTSRHNFVKAAASGLLAGASFTNHESLPALPDAYGDFAAAFPQYAAVADRADAVRAEEYLHLDRHVCLDYAGINLFSHAQMNSSLPSTSSSASSAWRPPFFDIAYKSTSLRTQCVGGSGDGASSRGGSSVGPAITKRIMASLKIPDDEYTMVCTANRTTAFRLLAESYAFHSSSSSSGSGGGKQLLAVYDYESEAAGAMAAAARRRGAAVSSATFAWPSMRIHGADLRKKLGRGSCRGGAKRRGLFVFPLASRVTGARYPYLWMSAARERGWHVALDACALGTKDLDTFGVSLLRPDFIVCNFFKVLGENPSGFAGLFVRKDSLASLERSVVARSIGVVNIVPARRWSLSLHDDGGGGYSTELDRSISFPTDQQDDFDADTNTSFSGPLSHSRTLQTADVPDTMEIREVEESGAAIGDETEEEMEEQEEKQGSDEGVPEMEVECRGLDHADALGLIAIGTRLRCISNWLVVAMQKLRHPAHSVAADNNSNGHPLVRVYGPRVKFERGPSLAFNVFDWKGERVAPPLVQKLADRHGISLTCAFLRNIWFSDKHEAEKAVVLERRTDGDNFVSAGSSRRRKDAAGAGDVGVFVVNASLGFLSNFEDAYRLWAFVAKFLDADFVEKERWRYTALNQKTIEV